MSQSSLPRVGQKIGGRAITITEGDVTAILKKRAERATQMLHELGFTDLQFCVYDSKGAWLAGEYNTDEGEQLLKFLDSDQRKRVIPDIFIGQIFPLGENRSQVVAVL